MGLNRNHGSYGLVVVVAFTTLGGCRSAESPKYQTAAPAGARDSVTAQKLNDEGLVLASKGDWGEAATRFRRALDHDLYYSPAHNNLGLALMNAGQYYEAAWEFEAAAKLAPTAVEPRVNLGRLYEATGRMEAAIGQYESAAELAPQDGATMRHLARAYIKTGKKDDRLKDALEKILLTQGEPQWDAWARGQLIRLGRDGMEQETFPMPAMED